MGRCFSTCRSAGSGAVMQHLIPKGGGSMSYINTNYISSIIGKKHVFQRSYEIRIPSSYRLLLCFKEENVPLLVAESKNFPNEPPFRNSLICFTQRQKSSIIVYSNIDLLIKNIDNPGNRNFNSDILKDFAIKDKSSKILVISADNNDINSALMKLGYNRITNNIDDNFLEQNLLIVGSSGCKTEGLKKRIEAAINEGINVLFAYQSGCDDDSLNLFNELIYGYGFKVGYSLKPEKTIIDTRKCDDLLNYSSLVSGFEKALEGFSLCDIDKCLIYLRLFVSVIDLSEVDRLYKICVESLKNVYSSIESSDRFVGLIILFMQDLGRRLPNSPPLESEFIGTVEEEHLIKDATIRDFNISKSVWNSTGVFLPPGKISTVTTDKCISVHVGAHIDIISHSNPWKRYPIAVNHFKVPGKQTQIHSQTGGIVYVTSETDVQTDMGITNVCRHDVLTVDDSRLKFFAPWCEIHLKQFIFTVPREFIRDDLNIGLLQMKLDEMQRLMEEDLPIYKGPQLRFIYDVECSDPLYPGYPIYMKESIMDILYLNNPLSWLKFVTSWGLCWTQNLNLHHSVEFAFCAVSAAKAVSEFFRNTPLENFSMFDGFLPLIFAKFKGLDIKKPLEEIIKLNITDERNQKKHVADSFGDTNVRELFTKIKWL